jgi:hypothetical protein
MNLPPPLRARARAARRLVGRARADAVSLYSRAAGYSYDAEKFFCDKNGDVTKVPYREHVPPRRAWR